MKMDPHIILVIIVCCMLTACEKSPQMLKPAGDIILVTRELSPYSTLVLYDNVDVTFCDTIPVNTAYLRGGEYLLDWIGTEVHTDSLVVTNNNTGNWLRSYKKVPELIIHPSGLRSIQYFSSGYVRSENPICCDTLNIDVRRGGGSIDLNFDVHKLVVSNLAGTCDIKLTGISYITYINNTSYGPVWSNDLYSEQIYMTNNGFSDVHVFAHHTFVAKINSSGNIYYYGNPEQVTLTCYGSGKFFKED